ncbi:MAG: superoxide dismutase [Bacteroidaceae bacterium]|nr:superoxide dismutase [Bacteroidaceae bacterium]
METKPVNGKFELIKVPFGNADLQPYISGVTLSFHYGKHLQAYVNNLNAALPGSGFEGFSLEDIVRKAEGGVFNNAGQILNHNLYFTQFAAPESCQPAPTGKLLVAIEAQFGSFEAFQKEFVAKGVSLFGSGWVWLSANTEGKLLITQEPNAGNPIRKGLRPLLTFDVWEHAYYLDYQNRRADQLNDLWKIVNWRVIEERYA